MAHYRKPLAAAAALNTAIFVVEAVAGFQADSLSLIMDSVHNLSDEMALVFLYLAFVLPHGVSRHLLRSANVFNSVGLYPQYRRRVRIARPGGGGPARDTERLLPVRSAHRRGHRRLDHRFHHAGVFASSEELIWPEK